MPQQYSLIIRVSEKGIAAMADNAADIGTGNASEDQVKALLESLGMITSNKAVPDSIKLLQIAQATSKKTGDPRIDALTTTANAKALSDLAEANADPLAESPVFGERISTGIQDSLGITGLRKSVSSAKSKITDSIANTITGFFQ